MTWLITGDLHLTDKPRDSHRFGIFKWLAEQTHKREVYAIFILGDLTEAKDLHSASLVNRIVEGLASLPQPVFILMGNHDYIDPNCPFFGFLSHIEGLKFITKPAMPAIYGDVVLIPHCRSQEEFDLACSLIEPGMTVMCHQTFAGAIADSSDRRLNGFSASLIEQKQPRAIWSGDIHRFQRVGSVTYVGSPYHCRFGDDFIPRVRLVMSNSEADLHYPAPRKWMLRIADVEELYHMKDVVKGDQVKVELTLAREEAIEWAKHKQSIQDACKELGLEVFGTELQVPTVSKREKIHERTAGRSHEEVFDAFCQAEAVASNIKRAGRELLQHKGNLS